MKNIILSVLVAVMLSLVFVALPASAAESCDITTGGIQSGANCAGQSSGLAKGSLAGYIKTVINVLLSVVGIVAVIMIIIGGFRYALSGGNESSVSSAKDTILYAVVGLVIAILAFAIVNFVLGIFF